MAVSVIDPLSGAWQRMMRVLFEPFDLGKWFTLGFSAFLASLGETAMHVSVQAPPPPGTVTGSGGPGSPSFTQWVQSHAWQIGAVALAIALFLFALMSVVFWLQSRGKFMLIDGLVFNRGSIVQPWRTFAAPGNSLARFKIVTVVICALLIMAGVAGGATIVWPDLQQGALTSRTYIGMWVALLTIGLVVGTYIMIALLLEDFIAPAMYCRGVYCMQAWRVVNREIFKGHVWPLTLFYLVRAGISFVGAFVGMVAFCVTCCIGALPYVSSVLLLPVIAFQRCYSLSFIEQFGADWRFFTVDELTCPSCRYDLRGNPAAVSCPECGANLQ